MNLNLYLMVIWLENLRFHNFQKLTYSISQIHKVEDENWFYTSSCSSTRFPLVEIQHISIFHAWLTIQIYFIYNHIILINMCLYYNLLEWIQFQGSKHDLKFFFYEFLWNKGFGFYKFMKFLWIRIRMACSTNYMNFRG
jgi:hypothetical protein